LFNTFDGCRNTSTAGQHDDRRRRIQGSHFIQMDFER
jgi:hypothetical protein